MLRSSVTTANVTLDTHSPVSYVSLYSDLHSAETVTGPYLDWFFSTVLTTIACTQKSSRNIGHFDIKARYLQANQEARARLAVRNFRSGVTQSHVQFRLRYLLAGQSETTESPFWNPQWSRGGYEHFLIHWVVVKIKRKHANKVLWEWPIIIIVIVTEGIC